MEVAFMVSFILFNIMGAIDKGAFIMMLTKVIFISMVIRISSKYS
jgi:hypothetical protein